MSRSENVPSYWWKYDKLICVPRTSADCDRDVACVGSGCVGCCDNHCGRCVAT